MQHLDSVRCCHLRTPFLPAIFNNFELYPTRPDYVVHCVSRATYRGSQRRFAFTLVEPLAMLQ